MSVLFLFGLLRLVNKHNGNTIPDRIAPAALRADKAVPFFGDPGLTHRAREDFK
jgi:hypothetical protein